MIRQQAITNTFTSIKVLFLVSLKNEISTPQQKKFETNGIANKKNIKFNDGLSAVHVPIKQGLNNSGNLQVF
jgi:hypothetical protein